MFNNLIINKISRDRGFYTLLRLPLFRRLLISNHFHSPIDVSVAVAVACLEQFPDTFLVANGARLAFDIRSLRHLLTEAARVQPSRDERLSVISPIAPHVITRLPPHPHLITFRVSNFNSRLFSRGDRLLSLSLSLDCRLNARLSCDMRRRVSHARKFLRYHRAIRQP